MKRNIKVKLAVILMSAFAILLLTMLFMPFDKTAAFRADDFQYSMDYVKELSQIPVLSQETSYTCNIASMAIVKTYLGFETTEQGVRSDLNLLRHNTGMLPNEYLKYANEAFEPLSYSVTLVCPRSEAEILNVISASLERNLPVVIFYLAKDDWNEPHYNTHYAVIYGIDIKNALVKISNPYGYLQQLSFVELFDGLAFSSYKAEPLLFRLGRRLGVVKSNSIFLFKNIQ